MGKRTERFFFIWKNFLFLKDSRLMLLIITLDVWSYWWLSYSICWSQSYTISLFKSTPIIKWGIVNWSRDFDRLHRIWVLRNPKSYRAAYFTSKAPPPSLCGVVRSPSPLLENRAMKIALQWCVSSFQNTSELIALILLIWSNSYQNSSDVPLASQPTLGTTSSELETGICCSFPDIPSPSNFSGCVNL